MARPKTPEDDRLENFTVRISKKDRATIEANAEKIGLAPSEFMRVSALKRTVRVVQDSKKADPALLGALSAIGNNLNQIAERFNETRRAPAPEALNAALVELYGVFAFIRDGQGKP